MTALAGLWVHDGRHRAAAECRRQLEAQERFGRDPQIWGDERLALGRRITPFLPEDSFDVGPLVLGDGRYVLIADVRLDNREELGRSLNLHQKRLAGLSDSSILLECLVAWGEGALDRLVGDFAFAFWDRDAGALMLARDYSGQRPLHYATGPGFFALASMPSGLHALEVVERSPNLPAAIAFMRHQPHCPRESFFDGVSQVAPGHILIIRKDAIHHRRWWDFDVRRERRPRRREDIVEEARELLDVAVSSRLRGGGSLVASHLSAGLDSSGVMATAARLLDRRGTGLLAFTAVPQPMPFAQPTGVIADEADLARQVAGQFANVDQVFVEGSGSLADVFERNVRLWQRPVPNPINDIWWSRISQVAASRGATVLLTGPMGNIGLSHSGDELYAELLGSLRWLALARVFHDARRNRQVSARRLALSMLVPFVPDPLWSLVQRVRGKRATPDFLSPAGQSAPPGPESQIDRHASVLSKRLEILATTNPAPFNAGAAAGWGIDMRDALSDQRLMEFSLSLPTRTFVDRGENRALARQALADRLPETVRREHRKGYQAADWSLVLRQNQDELVAEAEAIAASSARDIIDTPAILNALRAMQHQDWSSPQTGHVYGRALVGALSVGHFLRKATGRE